MATGRIRRTARRGIAASLLVWLGVATGAVLLAPSAVAAPTATIEIRNVTPPAASVDSGGTVTFVNRIPVQDQGGIRLGAVSVGATVSTDVSLDFFGEQRNLQTDQSTSWQFSAPATTGTITYTYRVVPQASLPLGVSAQQVVDQVLGSLPPLPAPTPYVVQTIAPALPNLPGVDLPSLPTVELPALPQVLDPTPPSAPGPPPPGVDQPQPAPAQPGTTGNQYRYDVGGGAQLSPGTRAAIAAFDPARTLTAGSGSAATGRSGSGGAAGSGGVAGSYDGASVPVFGQLAGLDGTQLEEESAGSAIASEGEPETLPAAALAAVVALAAVTAALVRTSQAARENR